MDVKIIIWSVNRYFLHFRVSSRMSKPPIGIVRIFTYPDRCTVNCLDVSNVSITSGYLFTPPCDGSNCWSSIYDKPSRLSFQFPLHSVSNVTRPWLTKHAIAL